MAEHFYRCPKLPWMIDFHSGADGKVLNSQLKAAYADNWLNYLGELNFQSQIPKKRLSGIMCTIGPSCNSVEVLEKMMAAGMTVARLKMAFFTHEECQKTIIMLRKANDNYSKIIGRIYPLAIAIEIKGPEIRTGIFKDADAKEIYFIEGNTTYLTTDPAYEEHVTEDMIFVDYQKINEVVEPGDQIYLENGKVRLSTLEIVGGVIKCLIERAGNISNNAKLCVPGVPIDLPSLSEKDDQDINFGMQQNVDAIIISCTRNAETVQSIREIMKESYPHVMLIAKIENSHGVDNFDDILNISDGIMISRNNLCIEVPPEKIFLIQKSIIARCNKAGKLIICGSLMLETMITSLEPSRSEISDIANVILDGADCLTLTKETAIGKYAVESINTLASICKEAEAATYQKQIFRDLTDLELTPIEPIQAVAISAVMASLKCNAAAIILCTTSGRTAKLISRYRPRCPIIAITRYAHVARQLHIFRGVDPILYLNPLKGCWLKDVEQRIQLGITYGKVSGFIRTGDALVILTGSRQGSGFTNSIKIEYASAFDTLSQEDNEKVSRITRPKNDEKVKKNSNKK